MLHLEGTQSLWGDEAQPNCADLLSPGCLLCLLPLEPMLAPKCPGIPICSDQGLLPLLLTLHPQHQSAPVMLAQTPDSLRVGEAGSQLCCVTKNPFHWCPALAPPPRMDIICRGSFARILLTLSLRTLDKTWPRWPPGQQGVKQGLRAPTWLVAKRGAKQRFKLRIPSSHAPRRLRRC